MKEFSSYYYTKSQENPPKLYIDIEYFELQTQTRRISYLPNWQEKAVTLKKISSVSMQSFKLGVNHE
jgi:hypothetical protein